MKRRASLADVPPDGYYWSSCPICRVRLSITPLKDEKRRTPGERRTAYYRHLSEQHASVPRRQLALLADRMLSQELLALPA